MTVCDKGTDDIVSLSDGDRSACARPHVSTGTRNHRISCSQGAEEMKLRKWTGLLVKKLVFLTTFP
jgi:hypothetical protein